MMHPESTSALASQPQHAMQLGADGIGNNCELDSKETKRSTRMTSPLNSNREILLHSFGPSFSDTDASHNLLIPRYALPHEALSSLNKSHMIRQPRSLHSSCAVVSGSSQAPSQDDSSTLQIPPFDTASYNPPARLFSATDFTALGRLGQGAHGQVLLVHDNVSDKYTALKVVEKDHLHLSSYPRIFEEQLVGQRLFDCPWALRLEASFQDNEYFYFLSKYHPVGDMTKLVRRFSKLPTNIARHYAAELIVAMEQLHCRHVMHRDIKPDNILIDDEGHLLLADFGVSRSFGDGSEARPWERFRRWANRTPEPVQDPSSTDDSRSQSDRSRTTCGTPGFMAPEAYEKTGYSYEADIWSAGVVIHFLLMGRLPFGMIPARQSYKELCTRTKVLQLEFGMDERVPGHARTLLRRMLDKDPARRISIADIKAHQFFAGICWETILRRKTAIDFPIISAYIDQKKSALPIEEGITMPGGTAYKPGECPFPWFEYCSPAISLPEDETPDLTTLRLDPIDTSPSSTTPQRKTSLANKFKGLWKRSPTVNHSP